MGWGYLVIFLVVIGIIISFGVLVIILVQNNKSILNGRCHNTSNCDVGLSCVNGFCKSNIGSSCTQLADCVPDAELCFEGVCFEKKSGPGGTPPCRERLVIEEGICLVPIGGHCEHDDQCVSDANCHHHVCVEKHHHHHHHKHELCKEDKDCGSGYLCDKASGDEYGYCQAIPTVGEMCTALAHRCGTDETCERARVIDRLGNDLFPHVKYSIRDLADLRIFDDNNEVVLLLEDGNFITDRDGRLKFIHSKINMDLIVPFNTTLYGISNGILYRLKEKHFHHKYHGTHHWSWIEQSWAPSDIVHISHTSDGQYLWVQNKVVEGVPDSEGYLYKQPDDFDDEPIFIEKVELKGLRNYGSSINAYVEFNSKRCIGTLFPRRLPISNICYGSVLSNGGLFKIGRKDRVKYRFTRIFNQAGVFITHRLCE